jgi:hypothetical protein
MPSDGKNATGKNTHESFSKRKQTLVFVQTRSSNWQAQSDQAMPATRIIFVKFIKA